MRKLLFSLVFLLLGGCTLGQTNLSSFELPPNVQITFRALAPEGTLEDAGLVLRLRDEITGFGLNPTDYEMKAEGERSYSLTLSVPIDTTLTYHYLRRGESLVPEAASGGWPIHYRIQIVNGAGLTAHDVIASWSDSPMQQPSGRISGTVTDAESGRPLDHVLVSAGGLQTFTDEQGLFALNGLMEGTHTLVAISPNGAHRNFQQGAIVAEGMDTPADIQMQPNLMVDVTLIVSPPEDNVPAVPVRMVGNLPQFEEAGALNTLEDGTYWARLQLPLGADIRYKYTLGDGFWNAEHDAGGAFVLRQMILLEAGSLEVQDRIHSWAAGASDAIWFDVETPGAERAYLQFRLVDWGPSLAMWPLGDGHFAYKLFSPTNFAAPLEYRYCLDRDCRQPEMREEGRFVTGGQGAEQVIEDRVEGWVE